MIPRPVRLEQDTGNSLVIYDSEGTVLVQRIVDNEVLEDDWTIMQEITDALNKK